MSIFLRPGQIVGALRLLRKVKQVWEVRCLLCGNEHDRSVPGMRSAVDNCTFSTCEKCRPTNASTKEAAQARLAKILAEDDGEDPTDRCYACGEPIVKTPVRTARGAYCNEACREAKRERMARAERERRAGLEVAHG